jgi:hypothetical protein
MGIKRGDEARRRKLRRRGFSIESLERRSLLTTTTETFVAPSLSSLITQAEHGKNTSQEGINTMVDALQAQLESGPLADLNSGAVTSNGFITEAQTLETSYEQNVDSQLSPQFPNIDILLKLQGQRVVANLIALNQQSAVDLISSSALATSSQTTIASLSKGPITALGTTSATITSTTSAFVAELNTLSTDLGNSTLTLSQVSATAGADAEAYRSDIHAGIQEMQFRISGEADTAIDALESSVISIAQTNPSDAQTQLNTAITTFDNAVLDTNGLFATGGALSTAKAPRLVPGTTNGQAVSIFSSVSGTSSTGATATLTATLTTTDGSPLMGETVGFTIDGAFAGIAITNFTGIATLTGVPTTAATGTALITAYFASDSNYLSTAAIGALTVSAAPTTVSNVSGTAVFGGPATLVGTLLNSSGQALANETLSFTLDGASVGTAVTNSSGIATLTGVTTPDNAGTDTGGVVATFAGDSTNAASGGTGNLVVSPAPTTLSNVGGTAQFGGTATLTATLTSNVTGLGIDGETLNFVLDNTIVGTAVTNTSGVATLSGVATTDFGTDTGGVIVTFTGDTNYAAAANGVGNLVVSPASTALASVSGTASFGGTATLTATLTSSVTSAAIPGATVSFTLDGAAVGTAVTDSSGVATLTGVPTTQVVGNDDNGVVATFAAIGTYAGTTGTGTLVVSQAPTTLSDVSGTSQFGGTATLVATLDSTVTNGPIAGQTVQFTLSGTSVGSAVTNSSGVATVTGVTANDAPGTITGAVVANYSGSTSYQAPPEGTGNLVISKADTTLNSVGGTASFGGTATLTATLINTANNEGVGSEPVEFTLNGTAVGSVNTNSSGVATLTGVATSAGVGTETGAVLASFAGDTNYNAAANTTGDLVVSKAETTLTSVGGTAQFGGTATLVATLTTGNTIEPIVGETVSFTLGGTAVGTAVTNSSGIATLTGVATTEGVGTDAGAVAATFAGDSNYTTSTATGDLVVSQAPTALSQVFANADFGGTATLSATLESTVTNQPIAGETVSFMLSNTAVGTAVTNSNGIATLTGVATSAGVGTVTGAVVASFSGDANYEAAANASGDLIVVQAATALASVGGTAQFGGTATLVATLTSTVTSQPIAGETVSFTLDNVTVGTAVTDSSGVATLTGVATTDGVGTDSGAVVATFAGDANYQNSSGTGDLVVSQAPTTLTNVLAGANFGGTATLVATLDSSVTGLPIAGETVSFTFNNVVVGTAVTGGNGVASLADVDINGTAVGSYPGVLTATFAGDANYQTSTGSGGLIVTQASTALMSVSGSAVFGGQSMFTATLTSNVTGLPIAGEDVTFTLDGQTSSSVVTDSNGMATFTGLPYTEGPGTYTDAVTANFGGDASYLSTTGTGDFTVSQAPTALNSVSGSSPVGGPATLLATLTSTVTNMGIPGETIDFTLDGVPVGTAVTDGSGMATLTGVPTSDPAGTDPGGVVANFGGDVNYQPSQGVGDLTVGNG